VVAVEMEKEMVHLRLLIPEMRMGKGSTRHVFFSPFFSFFFICLYRKKPYYTLFTLSISIAHIPNSCIIILFHLFSITFSPPIPSFLIHSFKNKLESNNFFFFGTSFGICWQFIKLNSPSFCHDVY